MLLWRCISRPSGDSRIQFLSIIVFGRHEFANQLMCICNRETKKDNGEGEKNGKKRNCGSEEMPPIAGGSNRFSIHFVDFVSFVGGRS
jgi:hypothetical protein